MKRTYQVVTKPSTLSSRELAEFLSKDGQLLLPLVGLLERGEKAIDEVIDVMGRATVEAVLRMSAEQLAGPKRQGRRADDRALYFTLSERQLRVEKPRLRKKTARQGAIPAITKLAPMLAILRTASRPGATRRSCRRWPSRSASASGGLP